MDEKDNIIGFSGYSEHEMFPGDVDSDKKGHQFDEFFSSLQGEGGFAKRLGPLKWQRYGSDLHLILFQIHAFLSEYSLENVQQVEAYCLDPRILNLSIRDNHGHQTNPAGQLQPAQNLHTRTEATHRLGKLPARYHH